MADGSPPVAPALPAPCAAQPLPIAPPLQPPLTFIQLIVPPAQPIPAWPIQPAHVPQLNWLHFKPEFASTPDEDAEAHLRTNDWMDSHAFQEGVKSPVFLSNISRRSTIMV